MSIHRVYRAVLLAGAVLLILGPGIAGAQPFGTDLLSVDSAGRLWRTTPTGNATVLLDLPDVSHGLCLDHDNTLVYVTQSGSPGRIVQFDPVNRVVVTMFTSSTLTPYEIIQNPDGDLVFTGAAPGPLFGLFKLSGGQVSTIITTLQLGVQTSNLSAGLEINADTGNYLLVGGAYAPWAGQQVWDISDSGVFVTLGSSGNSRHSHTQDPDTGNVYIAGWEEIYVLQRGTATAGTFIIGAPSYYAITMDRSSAPRSAIVARSPGHIFRIDIPSLTISSVVIPNSASTTYETIFDRHRNLATVKTGPRQWQIKLDFGTSEARHAYLIAMSLRGIRPAVRLPDGRRLHLVPDDLTVLTLKNQLPTIFDPGPCLLDARGEATGRLDLRKLPPLLGVPVFMAAMTVGPKGVGQISDPLTMALP